MKFQYILTLATLALTAISSPVPQETDPTLSDPVPADPEPSPSDPVPADPDPAPLAPVDGVPTKPATKTLKTYLQDVLSIPRFRGPSGTYRDSRWTYYRVHCELDMLNPANKGELGLYTNTKCKADVGNPTNGRAMVTYFYPYSNQSPWFKTPVASTPWWSFTQKINIDAIKTPMFIARDIVRVQLFDGQFLSWQIQCDSLNRPLYSFVGRDSSGTTINWIYDATTGVLGSSVETVYLPEIVE